LQARVRFDAPIPAPVAKGQELGKLLVSGQGVPDMEVPLIAGADVDRLGVIARIPAVISRWFGG
jgi:D-alanyl-D-alanine carboxypeptidase (penicillin-binding protein 5/6)